MGEITGAVISITLVMSAIIGTFFFLLVLGFTINVLTLFALVLAIGIVVDDAIVVVEAVHSKMEGTHLSGKEATHSAMGEITGAVISITLVMSAIIGTFFFLLVLGFTINVLTLFALVLAIGIVVDDAIVVVEAVHSKMEGTHLSGKEATHSAMGEITGA
eukprot:Opistho-2@84115